MSKVIVKIQGGLGNQLFQYAYGRALSCMGHEVSFDISFFENNQKYTKRNFSLREFVLSPEAQFVSQDRSLSLVKKVLYRLDSDRRVRFVKSFLSNPNSYMSGYFNSEEYFKSIRPQLLQEIKLKSKSDKYLSMESQIQNSDSLIIHARRGDYLNSSGFVILDKNYYQDALRQFENKKIFLFSDDPEWLKGIIGDDCVVVSGQGFTDYEELSLIAQGQNFIIANSTFSWWGAWLSDREGKKIVAPKHWFTSKLWWRANRDVVPKGWIRV